MCAGFSLKKNLERFFFSIGVRIITIRRVVHLLRIFKMFHELTNIPVEWSSGANLCIVLVISAMLLQPVLSTVQLDRSGIEPRTGKFQTVSISTPHSNQTPPPSQLKEGHELQITYVTSLSHIVTSPTVLCSNTPTPRIGGHKLLTATIAACSLFASYWAVSASNPTRVALY
jgi:hypothetical protein